MIHRARARPAPKTRGPSRRRRARDGGGARRFVGQSHRGLASTLVRVRRINTYHRRGTRVALELLVAGPLARRNPSRPNAASGAIKLLENLGDAEFSSRASTGNFPSIAAFPAKAPRALVAFHVSHPVSLARRGVGLDGCVWIQDRRERSRGCGVTLRRRRLPDAPVASSMLASDQSSRSPESASTSPRHPRLGRRTGSAFGAPTRARGRLPPRGPRPRRELFRPLRATTARSRRSPRAPRTRTSARVREKDVTLVRRMDRPPGAVR